MKRTLIYNKMKRLHTEMFTGFSLVELLVVMSIILLLAGIILVGVNRIRERAIMVKCQNNLREHGQALSELMVASTQTGPRYGRHTTASAGVEGWYLVNINGQEVAMRETDIRGATGIKGISTESGTRLSEDTYGSYLDFEIPAEVRFCPAISSPESLIDPGSPAFKGYGRRTTSHATWGWESGSVTKTDEEAVDITISRTTYALNTRCQNPSSIAYIDWNAEEGWGNEPYSTTYGWYGYLYHTTWQFSNPDKGILRGDSKGDHWWKTEVGFHHMGGANYITWGGRGGWVDSNDIDLSYFDADE